VDLGAAFPPARGVVEFRHLVQTELLVVIGPDPFGRIDGALLQRRIDLATRICCDTTPSLASTPAAKAADAKLQPIQVTDISDLATKPATI